MTKGQSAKADESYVLTKHSRAGIVEYKDREERAMRTTETIQALIRERGKKGEPLERV